MHQRIKIVALVVAATMTLTTCAFATTTLSTNFGSGGATGVGTTPTAPTQIPTALNDIINFNVANSGVTVEEFDGTPNLGGQAFVNSGPFYVSGNRSYGFAGTGRSDITFDPNTVQSVTLQVRGSDGQTSGGNSITIPGSTTFDESNVSLLIWSDVGVQSEVLNISNTGFQTISLDVATVAGDFISRISLINGTEANPVGANSIAFIGQLSVELIPEPTTVMLGLCSIAGVLVTRRRG